MSELVVISANDEAALVQEMERILGFIGRAPEVPLIDVAYTCSLTHGASAISIIANDIPSFRARLVSAVERLQKGGAKRLRDKSGTYYFSDHLLGENGGKLAFVYPGVMGFYPDMMRDLAIDFPECRSAFDELEAAFAGDAEFTPSSFIFPPASYYRHDADIFKSGAYAQAFVSTFAGCNALTRLLTKIGLSADGVVGFAGGDITALMNAGVSGKHGKALERSDRIKVIRDIYRVVHKAVNNGGLSKVAVVTVLLRREGEIDELIKSFPKDKVTMSVDFSPRQKTFVVSKDYEAEIFAAFSAAGVRAMRMQFDRPFNTKLCSSLVPEVRKFTDAWVCHEPMCDIYSCADAEAYGTSVRALRKESAKHWAEQVRFVDTIRKMYADGYRVFLEVGPRGLVTAAVADTLKGCDHAAITMNSIHRSGELQLQHAVGQLVAYGAKVDISRYFARRNARKLDFDAAMLTEVRKDSEMQLSRAFPQMTLLSGETLLKGANFLSEPRGRGAKAAARAAAVAQQARRQRQFDFGAVNPLVSDADMLESSPGVLVEIVKNFKLSEFPFVGDAALGTSQMSYADPNLKGLVPLTISFGAEIIAEVAGMVVPNRTLIRIEDLNCPKFTAFDDKGELKLFIRAERIASGDERLSSVKVVLREDAPGSEYVSPVMEATAVLADEALKPEPVMVEPLSPPYNVHWSGRDIYPGRLHCGRRLRGIQFVESWGDFGLDYTSVVPPLAGNVTFTRFPAWRVNPLLLEIISGGFALWRSHERFPGAFSFPFRMRRLQFYGQMPEEGAKLKCYMRLTGVTPRSQISDITVSDGNGKELLSISGWEELTERVPVEYRSVVLQPANSYLSEELDRNLIGDPATDVATAFIVDVPYSVFERNDELWLKTLSHVVLAASERHDFAVMGGAVSRRVEWLFGRVVAKEAVRRFLKNFYQARWSSADVGIWPNDYGKPVALGAWNDYLSAKLDVSIAHTSRFLVAIAAANARVGVDVESVKRDLSDEFAAGVFNPEELELAAQAADASLVVIKFWCAKEAVSKALGTGIRYSPKEMVVSGYDADAGTVTVKLEGAWVEAFKNLKGRDIVVTVKTVREFALASCFIPATLFDE